MDVLEERTASILMVKDWAKQEAGGRQSLAHSIPGRGRRFFSSPLRPDQLWDPSNLLYYGAGGCFLWDTTVGAWNWPLTAV
jgi:hypothetical protein